MTWSSLIWIYLWLAGMAGGAYFAAFVASRSNIGNSKSLLHIATYIGIPLAVLGVLLLLFDLGRPLDFWHLLTQFKLQSPMSMGTWILLLWVTIAVIIGALLWFQNNSARKAANRWRRVIGILGWANFVLSALLITYTGVLLANSSQPMWAGTVFLPPLFVASAVSTGLAILIVSAMIVNAIGKTGIVKIRKVLNYIFGTADWTVSNRNIAQLAEADAIVIGVELVLLIAYVVGLANSGTAGTGESLQLLISGVLAAPFWLGVIIMAILIPFALDIANWGKQVEARGVWRAILASAMCVILGGLVLRAVITIGGQM